VALVTQRIGDLRERVTLQTLSRARDDYGGAEETWTTTATVWANVATLGGSEQEEGTDQVIAQLTHSITIRYRIMDPTMRVVWRDKYLNVLQVIDADNRRRFLELRCSEVID